MDLRVSSQHIGSPTWSEKGSESEHSKAWHSEYTKHLNVLKKSKGDATQAASKAGKRKMAELRKAREDGKLVDILI